MEFTDVFERRETRGPRPRYGERRGSLGGRGARRASKDRHGQERTGALWAAPRAATSSWTPSPAPRRARRSTSRRARTAGPTLSCRGTGRYLIGTTDLRYEGGPRLRQGERGGDPIPPRRDQLRDPRGKPLPRGRAVHLRRGKAAAPQPRRRDGRRHPQPRRLRPRNGRLGGGRQGQEPERRAAAGRRTPLHHRRQADHLPEPEPPDHGRRLQEAGEEGAEEHVPQESRCPGARPRTSGPSWPGSRPRARYPTCSATGSSSSTASGRPRS